MFESDALIRIETSRPEVGEGVRFIPTAPMIEADILASIRNDKFSQPDPIENEQLDRTAFDWYGKAAERGNLEAIVSLGIFYLEGRGIDTDSNIALKLFNDASDKGSTEAMRQLATIYLQGEIVKKDYDLAAAFYRKAADKGDASSQFNLAVMLEKGQGIDRDKDAEIAWYQDAARQGHNSSQKRLLKLQMDW